AVRAWPTVIFVDPHGKAIGKHEGEFEYETFDTIVGEMLREFEAEGSLDPRALDFLTHDPPPTGGLAFPGKVAVDAGGARLFIADTNHHRVVVADSDGRVRSVVGAGEPGLADGDAATARFAQPQGVAHDADRDLLYVADTENHAIRQIDLKLDRV